MHITHVALWTANLERQVRFWTTFFPPVAAKNMSVATILALNLISSPLNRERPSS